MKISFEQEKNVKESELKGLSFSRQDYEEPINWTFWLLTVAAGFAGFAAWHVWG